MEQIIGAHRLSKIYTRTGRLTAPQDWAMAHALPKMIYVLLLWAMWMQLNSSIGILRLINRWQRSIADKASWDKSLSLIQHWLFDLGR